MVKTTTPGGRTLAQHALLPGTLKLIDEGAWDVVILQGQSQEAAASEMNETIRADFLKGAGALCKRIQAGSPKAKIVFYQTWARHADYWQKPDPKIDLGTSPAEMQNRNRKWYQQAAAQNPGSLIAPTGDAWELHYQKPGAVRLHKPDHSHPEWEGTYLACLVLYRTVFQSAKLDVSLRGKLPQPEAAYFQGIAAQVVQRPEKP